MARGFIGLLCLAGLLTGCDFLEWQALRLYLAVNPNLELEDMVRGPTSRNRSA